MSRQDNLTDIEQVKLNTEAAAQQEKNAIDQITQPPYTVISEEANTINFPFGLSGSLTQLTDGTSYLVAGENIEILSSSNGQITISSVGGGNAEPGGSDTYVQFNDGGSALSGVPSFTFDKTAAVLKVTNISGSLTKLTSGEDYIVPGANVTVSRMPNGSTQIGLDEEHDTWVRSTFTIVDEKDRGDLDSISATTAARNAVLAVQGGSVLSIVSDGAGGCFIGGSFTEVQGRTRAGIAHIDNFGQVTDWNPTLNGFVNSLVLSGSTLFAAGRFQRVGVTSSSTIELDATTEEMKDLRCNGDINVAVELPDGSTIVAGTFTRILGKNRNRLAKINPDGTLNSWNPGANGAVNTLAISGTTLYVGGSFTGLGGGTGAATRMYLGSIDANTGDVLPWNTTANSPVRSIVLVGTTLYVGGEFTLINGITRRRLCAIDTETTSHTPWDPDVTSGWVNQLIVSGQILYVGGVFSSVGAQTRNNAAALDISTTATSVIGWNPNFNTTVNSLAISGTTIYAGGLFTTVGSTNTRRGLAAVSSLGAGSVTSWDPNLSNASISSVIIRDSNVYVMGTFGSNFGRTIYLSGFAKIDLTSGNILSTRGGGSLTRKLAYANNKFYIGSAVTKQSNNFVALDTNYRQDLTSSIIDDSFITPFIGTFNDDNVSVSCLALSGTTLYAGGGFTSINGLSRNRLCAINTQTMSLVGWNPGANGTVNSLQVSGSNLYVGGVFTGLGGGTGTTTRTRLGAINSSTGVVDPSWNPRAESTVNSIAISGSIAYVGGWFTSLTGSSGVVSARNRLGAINTSTGEVTSWNPGVSNIVRSLAISGSNVYAAGISSSRLFPIMGGLVAKRDSKGFFDVTSLNLNGTVEASVTLPDGSFIIGGAFTSVLGQTRNRLAKINPNGTLNSWNPGANGTVNVLALDVDPSGAPASQNPGFLYVGGTFTGLGGGTGTTTRNRIGRIDASTGTVLPWYPTGGATRSSTPSVNALHVFGSNLYVGGLFTTIGGLLRENLVRIDRTTGAVDPSWCTLGASWTVKALASRSAEGLNPKIYVGGEFSILAGRTRRLFGVLDANSGNLSEFNPALGLGWNPGKSTTTSVNDIKVSGSSVFVGGDFTSVVNNTGDSAILSLRDNRDIIPNFTISTTDSFGDSGVQASIVLSDGSIIVQGSFTRIQGETRSWIAKINANGTLSSWAPTVNGKIRAMAVSGTTLYIGGEFTSVNGSTRIRLAAIDTNTGGLTTWNPGANGAVYAIAISGTVVYVGGDFTRIGAGQEAVVAEGSARSFIGAINTSGTVTTFNPGANGSVWALAVVGTTVYVGGAFTTIGGGGSGTSQRNSLASLTTAGAVSGWNPNPNGYIRWFTVSGTTLYIGGDFTNINGQTRTYIAAIDTATGLNTAWTVTTTGYIHDIAFSGSNIFVAGQFGTIGTDSTRKSLSVVDSTTGSPTFFDFNYSFSDTLPNIGTVKTLPNDRLFIGGSGLTTIRDATSVLEPDIENLIVLDAESGQLDPRYIQVSGSVSEINISGSNVYLVGNVSRSYNRARRGAMFNTADIRAGDLVLSGQMSANGTIFSSAPLPDGGFVFSGNFSRVGGKRRNRLARVNRDGSLHSWAPGMSPTYANAMVLSGSTLFLGGAFTHLTGSSGEVFSRAGLGAIDVDTGAVTPWVRTIGGSGYANALALSGSSLYVGGRFTTVGSSRSNIAEVSTTGVGTTTGWDPGANGDVNAIVVSGSVVYVGGAFTRLGGGGTGVATKLRIGAIDRSTGLATNWGPSANGDVSNLQISGSTVYVGGGFSLLTGSSGAILSRDKLGAIDKDTGEITSWVPKVNANFVYRMAISGSNLYVGRSNGLEAYELIAGEYRLFDRLNTTNSIQIRALAVTGSTLFVGGDFDVINQFSTDQGFLCVDSRTGIQSDENSSLISFVGAGTNNFSSVAFSGEAGSQTVLLAGTQTISSASVSGDAIHKLPVNPAGLNDLRPWTDARNKRSARQLLSDISVIATGSIFMSDGIAIGGSSTSYETSSSLSYGGISTRNVSYVVGDDGTLDIIYDYYHGTNGASGEAGVGKYFFTLPAGFVIDRSVVQVGSVFSGNYHPNMSVGTATVQCDSAGGGGTWSVVPVDSKRFVLVGKDPTSDQVSVWGADSFPLSLPEIKVSVRAKIPVVETYF